MIVGLVFILGVYMSLFIEVCIAYQLYSSIKYHKTMGCCKIFEWDEIRTNKLGDLNAYNWGTCSSITYGMLKAAISYCLR
jgi:hypothetical protein